MRYEIIPDGAHVGIRDRQTGKMLVREEAHGVCEKIRDSLDGTTPTPALDEAWEVAELIAYQEEA